jgi:hypothetical protein
MLTFASFSLSTMQAIDGPRLIQLHRTAANPSVPEHVDRIAAAFSLDRERFTSDWRDIMFAYFLEKLGEWIERAEERRRHDYLAQATDLADVEQRMRHIERNGYSF